MLGKMLQRFFDLTTSAWRWVRKWSALLILVVASAAFAFNFRGVYFSSNDQVNGFDRITNSAYESTQSLLLSTSLSKPNFNIWIGLGRVAAILLVALLSLIHI